MQPLLDYLLIPAVRPAINLGKLYQDQNKLRYALLVQLAVALWATLNTWVGWRLGFSTVEMDPWLAIPVEQYYRWSTWFTLPVSFLVAIVTAGVMRLLGAIFRGEGEFETQFALYVFAMALPTMVASLLPDSLVLAASAIAGRELALPAWIDSIRTSLGEVLWPLFIFALGFRRCERLPWFTSAVLVILGFIPAVLLTLIFIR